MPLVFRAMAILPKIAQYQTSCPPPKKTCQSQFLPLPPPASTCLYLMAEADLSALNSTTFCTNVDVANSCTYVCIRMLCLYTYMYLCMYVCMCVCVCVLRDCSECNSTHTRTHTHTHTLYLNTESCESGTRTHARTSTLRAVSPLALSASTLCGRKATL